MNEDKVRNVEPTTKLVRTAVILESNSSTTLAEKITQKLALGYKRVGNMVVTSVGVQHPTSKRPEIIVKSLYIQQMEKK